VIPGEPIHLRLDSAGAETLEMHTTAGQLTMKENEATVDTQGLKPGDYSINIATTKAGKKTACTVHFRVFLATAAIEAPNYQVVKIFYGTDRRSERGAEKVSYGERDPNGKLSFGTALVSIPRDHRMGELERPSLLKLEFREDPEKHVVLLQAAKARYATVPTIGRESFCIALIVSPAHYLAELQHTCQRSTIEIWCKT
jgi:hypothetical protein